MFNETGEVYVPCIHARNVSVVYGNGFKAIENVSFELNGGTICALMGINGGGKSTLFKSIMGLVKTHSGEISLSTLSVADALKKTMVAYVPQSEDIDWDFPVLVKEVVMQGRFGYMNFLRRPSKKDHEAVEAAMQRLGVDHLKDRQIGELSGGQKKRVFLARALAQKSMIILLDEPFTGVDFNTENVIMDLLQELKAAGHLILVSTHNLGNVPDYCNEVIFINRTIIDSGATEAVFNQENIKATFGGVLRQVGIPQSTLHTDDDGRQVTIFSDHEKPAVFYGDPGEGSSVVTESK
ncbi:metal ABC transporter ATP-binding protein [Reinekea thalattae]|uniref:Metal ABC transporter ATP-binding protein n=1 Tax=Reinekea thalattae TaxID=2593301 RepID=A0A5C8ZA29_9GAMM|nr:metal ABC transporter ATP-binding protein [Reinekea thalattae]TXR54812.1 metal ABC transporter ATP-binding protein [Reinekea thalattae]